MIAAFFFAAVVAQSNPTEDPALRKDRELNCAEWARTANHYLRLGEEKAIAELIDRSGPKPTKFAIGPNHAAHILRLLYQPKKGETLRRPLLGGWGDIPSEKNWPEFPFVIHSGVIFMFVDGYRLAGLAETPSMYAKYLRENGLFRSQFFAVPTSKEAKSALDLLVKSARWRDEFYGSTYMKDYLSRQTNYRP